VDVVLRAAPADARTRYQIARDLAALGPGAPLFAAAQQALAIPGSVVASGMTREDSQRVLEVLEEHGARARVTAAVEDVPVPAEAPGAGGPSFVLVVIVLALAGFGLWAWSRNLGVDSGEIDLPQQSVRADQGPELSTRELAERVLPATVSLRCASSLGSAFFVARDLALTNAHVLCAPGETLRAVFANGREIPATVEGRDDWLDLALVRVPGAGVSPLPLGDMTALRTGDHVVLAGNPEGLELTVHEGIVSHQARSIFGIAFLQIDADVHPGNSGGPLLDKHGRVVGVVSSRLAESEGLGFALPINYAYASAPRLLPPPLVPQPDERSWQRLLAEVSQADRKEVRRARSEAGRPALIGLTNTAGKGLVAMLARRSPNEPQTESVSFLFRNNDRVLCKIRSVAEGWRKIAETPAEPQVSADSRYLQWMSKNGLQGQVFLGEAVLDVQGCPVEEMRGAELILEGADERADRVGV
jgi:S1-C subfamily serine protease